MVTVSNLTVSQSTVVGPNIVPENMVLYLDALSLSSYPGSGTTWYDISGNSNDFTLVNSPAYIGNGFTFNGTSQYAQCVNTTGGNFGSGSFTLEYVLNIVTQQIFGTVLAKRAFTTYNTGYPGYYYRYTGVFQVYDTATLNNGYLGNAGPLNQTIHLTHRVVWTGTSVAKSLYENGKLIATATATNPGTNNSDNAVAMSLMGTSQGYTQGTVYLVRAYNKALTPLEIYQNFDATRYRYGI